ncbi:MAG: DNA repair protein RecO [Bryobacteraceae bacterium]|nr:DNA repair protein RecO [Bryobacteraceae bacterium]
MPASTSDSLILKTFPFGEADLIVSYLTREQGKLRGVAKRARRPKSNFGAGLERLSQVQMTYFLRENRDLGSLDSCEIIQSTFPLLATFEVGVALDYMAEVTEELLPPHEPAERFYRLLVAVLDYLHTMPKQPEYAWPAILYFSLWAVRLSGFLPGLPVKEESLEIAREMFQKPIRELEPREWTKDTASDLRRFLYLVIQEQTERRILSAPMLEDL